MKEYQYFRVELEGHIATITISRPKALNALSWDLVTELETVIDDVSAMEDVSAPASCTKSKTCPSLPSQQSMVTHSAAALR